MGKIILIVVAVLILAAGIFLYWTNKSSNPSSSATPKGQTMAPAPSGSATTSQGEVKVLAQDQSDGDVLVVDSVMLVKPGFVVIHKATKDGKPGTVVGKSAYLTESQSQEMDIDVSPVAKKGDVYFAMLHEDTNGNKKYDDESTDMAVKDAQGNVVMSKFTITSAEEEPSTTGSEE